MMGGGPSQKFTSPRRGEVDARSAAGEGERASASVQGSGILSKAELPHPALSPSGRGLISAIPGDEDFSSDHLKNAFRVFEHLVVPEADYTVTEGFDDLSSANVALGRVLAPVQFDCQVKLAAGEVCHKVANRELPEELDPLESASSKKVPKPLFSFCAFPPQFARDWRQTLFRQCRVPSSQPSPRRGEGVIRHGLNPIESVHTVNA